MDVHTLVDAFEDRRLGPADFPHEAHVRVAWGLAQRYAREEAYRHLTAGIRAIAARAGKPGIYHETMTRAWFELIAGAEDLARHPELFDKRLLRRYYTPEALAEGRDRWVAPDVQPLRLAPDTAAAARAGHGRQPED
jgi:hypothetical protein